MAYIARLLRLLGIVVWIGGLVFFAFVEAPTAFHVMGTTQQFAQIIGGSIATINRFGFVSGFAFLGASLLLWRMNSSRGRRLLLAEATLVALMLATTAYVQLHIVPSMERDRAAVGGDITSVPADNPTRVHFNALHATSEDVEGTGLFFGLGVVLLMAAEDTSRDGVAATR